MNDEFCNENSPLELKCIDGAGLGVYAKTNLKKENDNKKLQSVLPGIVNKRLFEGVEWSNVIGKVTKTGPNNNRKKKEVKKNLLGLLDFVNHPCKGHSNCKFIGDQGITNYWRKIEKCIKEGDQIVMSYSHGSQMKRISKNISTSHEYRK